MGHKSRGEEVNCGFMKGMFMVLKFHVFCLQNIVEVYLCINVKRKSRIKIMTTIKVWSSVKQF